MIWYAAHAGHEHEPGIQPFVVIAGFVFFVVMLAFVYYLGTKQDPNGKNSDKES